MHKQVKDAPRPGTPQWQRQVTASKIPTILGLNKYQTASELWMVMSGLAEPEHLEGDHLDWGHDAEDSLVNWWKRKHPGWRTSPGEIAYEDTSLPGWIATLDRRAVRGRAYRIIECKTSVDTRIWDSEEELPGHVHAQVIAQMGISGIHTADVVSQLGSTVPRIFPVEWEPDLWDGIVATVHDFVQTLGNAEPPQPPQDLLDALIKSRRVIDQQGELELEESDPQLQELRRIQRMIAELKDDERQAQDVLLERAAGRAITVDGKKITRKSAGRFSEKRVPEEGKHLLMDPDVLTTKLDVKKFKAKYPELALAATGDDSLTIPYKEA